MVCQSELLCQNRFMPEPSHAALRYRDAVNQIGEQHRFSRGWKTAAAKLLGVHPSYISKVADGKVTQVGTDVVEKAIAAGFDREFFAPDTRHAPTIREVADGLRKGRDLPSDPADLSWMMGEAVRLATIVQAAPEYSAGLGMPMVQMIHGSLFYSVVKSLFEMIGRTDQSADVAPLVRELAEIVVAFDGVVSKSPATPELIAISARVQNLRAQTGELNGAYLNALSEWGE